MKNAKELTQEISRIRARAKSLSGFWISELAAAMYALEWVAGRRDTPPSEDIGSAGGEHGKIADRLLHAVSAGAATVPARPSPRPSPRSRGEGEKKEPKKPASAPRRKAK